MNPDTPPPDGRPTLDDLAVFALDAVEPEEAQAIEPHLVADAGAASTERALRVTAGELGASAGRALEVDPPSGLRARTLAAAHRSRPPHSREAATPAEIHRAELSRALTLLRRIKIEDWARPVDPPEFEGWTVHDVAAHLVANESLLAAALGAAVPTIPEVEPTNEHRTALTRARHRNLAPSMALDELEAAAEAVDARAAALTGRELDATIEFWAQPMSIRHALVVRAFETWTHADDVRRSLGLAELPPPAPSLRSMSRAAVELVPIMLAVRGVERPGRTVRFHLTGPGGTSLDVPLDRGAAGPPGGTRPDAVLTLDVVDFCRAVSNRRPADGVRFTSDGDRQLAAEVVDAIPALAVL